MTNDTKFKALKEILYGAGISFILGMIGYVLMFFFKLIAARHFGPSDFGMYEMVVTIFGVAVVFGGFGIPGGIQRYVPYYIEKKEFNLLNGYIKYVKIVPLIFSLFVSFLIFLNANNITTFFNFDERFNLLLFIIAIGIPINVLNSVLTNILLAKKRPFQANFGYNVVEKSVLLIGAIIIVFLDLPLYFLAIFFISGLFLRFILSYYFLTKIKLKLVNLTKYEFKDWFKFSLPLIFTGILAYILSWTDNFVIGRYLTSTELGLYGISYSMASYLIFFTTIFATLFLPVITSLFLKDKENFYKIFNQVTKWVFVGTIFLGAILIYFSKQILTILFGSEYTSAYLSLSILSFFFILTSIFSFSGYILTIKKQTMFGFLNYAFFSIFNIILNIFLINRYGIEGVAFASGISLLLVRVSSYIKVRKEIKLGRLLLTILKIIFLSAILILFIKILFVFILNNVNIHIFIKLFIALSFYTFVFILGLFKLKVLDKEDMQLLLLIEKKSGLNLGFIKKILKRFV